MIWMWPMPGRTRLTIRLAILCLSASLLGGSLTACRVSQPPDADDRVQAAEQLPSLESVADIRRDPASRVILYATGSNLARALATDPDYRRARERHDAGRMALRFVEAYREDFLIADPMSEFRLGPVTEDDLGFTRVRLRQVSNDLPVVGAELSLQFNNELALELLQGRYIPTPRVTPEDAKLSSEDAAGVAAEALGQDIHLSEPELVIYPLPDGRGVLAYQVTGTRGLTESWRITIDAVTGEALAKEPLRYP